MLRVPDTELSTQARSICGQIGSESNKGEDARMNCQEVIAKAQEHIANMGKRSNDGVTSMSRTDGGWTVCIEVLERKAIPDTMDILGLYEIILNNDGDLLSLERKKLRKRGDTGEN